MRIPAFVGISLLPITVVFLLSCQAAPGDPYEHLGQPPRPSIEVRPVYSPDGQFIAFNSNRAGVFDIYILEVATGDIRQITEHRGHNYVPRWSPDGKRLAFYSNYLGNPWTGEIDHDVYVVNADGSDQQAAVSDPSDDMFADWLPDGTGLVFASDRGGTRVLHTLNLLTGVVVPLFDPDEGMDFTMFQPRIHLPTGDVVFEGYREGNSDVWLFDSSDRVARQLTNTPADEYGPAISPDGTMVLFQVADEQGRGQVGMVNITGTDYRVVTSMGAYTTPIWGPSGNIVTIYYDPDAVDGPPSNWNLYTLDADGTT